MCSYKTKTQLWRVFHRCYLQLIPSNAWVVKNLETQTDYILLIRCINFNLPWRYPKKPPRYLGRDSMVAQSGIHERSFQDRRLTFPSVTQRLVSGTNNRLYRIRERFKVFQVGKKLHYYSFLRYKIVHWTHATLQWPIRAQVIWSEPIKCKMKTTCVKVTESFSTTVAGFPASFSSACLWF